MMGTIEELAELDAQLKAAEKRRHTGAVGLVSGIFLMFVFFPLGILVLIFAIIFLFSGSKSIREIKLRQARLK